LLRIFIASEEAGPGNKLGGIWDVVHAESRTITKIISTKQLGLNSPPQVYVVGPYYRGYDDWHTNKRKTNIDSLKPWTLDEELKASVSALEEKGATVKSGLEEVEGGEVRYLLLAADGFKRSMVTWKDRVIRRCDMIKGEAYDLVGLRSDLYEKSEYGAEFDHYLCFSYAVSELLLNLSDAAALHCHEYPTFYAAARLNLMKPQSRILCTFHATQPGRTDGFNAIKKIQSNDGAWPSGLRRGMAELELLARHADLNTFVSTMTANEANTYYGIRGVVVRNGVYIKRENVDWGMKAKLSERIRKWLAENIHRHLGGEYVPPENILVWFTVSRPELENKGYHLLCDTIRIRDRLLKKEIELGLHDPTTREIVLMVAAHGRKDPRSLPPAFPLAYAEDTLIGEEYRLVNEYIRPNRIGVEDMVAGRRVVAAVAYPQWIGPDDGGLGLNVDELASGCVGGVFISYYEPFLLTGPECAAQGTPTIISKACGFSDAINEYREETGRRGLIVIDNLGQEHWETAADVAASIEEVDESYLHDRERYRMLCVEAFELTKKIDWDRPVERYFEMLTGSGVKG